MEDSAANRAYDDDFLEPLIESVEPEDVRPRFRMVAGGAPVVEEEEYPDEGVDGDSDVDGWLDSKKAFEARLEARMDNGYGGNRAPFLKVVNAGKERSKAGKRNARSGRKLDDDGEGKSVFPGLKKRTEKQILLDLPPTPRGCEWRRSDEGLNLWRCWTEWDDERKNRIKKSRYAGHLSDDGWRIMKEYDHEAFISTVGERLRRYSGR